MRVTAVAATGIEDVRQRFKPRKSHGPLCESLGLLVLLESGVSLEVELVKEPIRITHLDTEDRLATSVREAELEAAWFGAGCQLRRAARTSPRFAPQGLTISQGQRDGKAERAFATAAALFMKSSP